MKKFLSLSLTIVMMLSCLLGQAVLVSAADAVNYNDAPYAGVYAVSADKATTVTTEIGSVATLAAGETGYVYLLKGANVLTNSANANLTFTGLAGNGLAYLDQVTAEIPLAPSSISELTLSGNYTNPQAPYTDYGAAGVALGTDGSVDVTLTAPAAGLYVTQIQFATDAQAQMTVESDTGFYGVINQQAGRVGWNELHQGTHGVGNQDMEIMFLRAGANTITFKNTGAVDTLITKIKLAKTGSLASLEAYNWQLNLENLKPVLVEGFEPEPDPEPTPEAPNAGTKAYDAALAGVYEVSSDKDVTVTTEIGSVATLAAGETGYVYLLKGENNLTISDDTANLTITALEGNGLEYLDQVTAEIPLAPSSISELTLSGNYTNPQAPYNDYGAATGVAIGPKGSVDVTLTAPAAGLYVTQIQFATDAQAQMTVESDTGFYGVINQQAGRIGWNELHQGEHGVDNQDMEIIFLRAGANTITFKNTGAVDTLITKIKMAKTGSLASLEAYNWQLNLENLKPVSPVVDSFINNVNATVSGDEIALSGRIGAEWMDKTYGVEFASNKTGTRAQKYYGAKPGDTVGDYNGSTTFTFGEWDGTFKIILQGVSAGEKEYKFFVGNDYTETATVTVE